MGNGNADTTKFPDKGVPNKNTNDGERWLATTTSSKSARGTSNTTTLTLSRILLLYLDIDTEEIDEEKEDDNLILSPPIMVNGLEWRTLS